MSSDEESEGVVEDSKDEPVMKTLVSNFVEDVDGDAQEAEAMGMRPSFLL